MDVQGITEKIEKVEAQVYRDSGVPALRVQGEAILVQWEIALQLAIIVEEIMALRKTVSTLG